MVRAARQLQEWRTTGALTDEARGIIASAELANYCAWFAPLEKVFLNSRYKLHRPELPEFVAIRKGLELIPADEPPDPKSLLNKLGDRRIEYVAVHGGPGDGGLRSLAMRTSIIMWLDTDRWSPWYLNGRSMISGWRPDPKHGRPSFAALRIDPIALAFGPKVEQLPPGEVRPIPAAMGWEEEFLRGEGISPAGADEAVRWREYGGVRTSLIEQRQQGFGLVLSVVNHTLGGVGGVSPLAIHAAFACIRKNLSAEELSATPFLAPALCAAGHSRRPESSRRLLCPRGCAER